MPADLADWSGIRRFRPEEWPEGVLRQMDFRVIRVLSEIRDQLPSVAAFDPSPVPGAHVRSVGLSRHSTSNGQRLSDATDFFVDWRHAWRAWEVAQQHPQVGGLGIYTDMQWHQGKRGDRAMLHIDLRPSRILWVAYREKQHTALTYVYHTREPLRFHNILAHRGDVL